MSETVGIFYGRPGWMSGSTENDWLEDSEHENGNYFNRCIGCDSDFVGHKRRNVCRKCVREAQERYEAMSDEERAEHDAAVYRAISDFWKSNNHPTPTNPNQPRTGKQES